MVDLGRRRDEIFRQQGITFAITGSDGSGVQDRPFPLDLVPRIIPAAEWEAIERGLAQRLRALNSFIDDVYHGREIVRERIVPWELVLGSPQFRRAVMACARRAGFTATSPVATWSATPTAAGGCSRTTAGRRRGSPTCSRTGWR